MSRGPAEGLQTTGGMSRDRDRAPGGRKSLETDGLALAIVEPWATPLARLRFRCAEPRAPDSLSTVTVVGELLDIHRFFLDP